MPLLNPYISAHTLTNPLTYPFRARRLRVADNILACSAGVVLANRSSRPRVSSVRFTNTSFAIRWRLSKEMYNEMGALRGYLAVKFDYCNNLLSSVHTISAITLRLWQFAKLNTEIYYLLLL